MRLVGAGTIGVVVALVRRREFGSTIATFAYFDNPFEYWAYRNDKYWPPSDAHPSFVWRAPSKVHIEEPIKPWEPS